MRVQTSLRPADQYDLVIPSRILAGTRRELDMSPLGGRLNRMPRSTKEAFEKYRQNLEITGLQKETVSKRQQAVREVVEAEMDVLDSFLTGSYSRATMVSPLTEADIDILMVLDPKHFEQDGQASLLDKVRRALLKKYTRTPKISRNGQAVTIIFTDFRVDVVPGFNRKGGGYLIPNSISGSWIATNPKVHVDLMTEQNKSHAGDLVPLVKMIKGWNKNIGDAFVSFYLELIAIEILSKVTISDFSSGARYFFDKGRERIKTKAIDPAGFGDQINGLRNTATVEEAVRRFETAYNRAIKAEAFAARDNVQDAIEEWQKVFGQKFPSYG
jgi:hypothetical protein